MAKTWRILGKLLGFDERQPFGEDDHWWHTSFDGGQTLMNIFVMTTQHIKDQKMLQNPSSLTSTGDWL